MADPVEDYPVHSGRWLLLSAACAVFVLTAVVLEVTSDPGPTSSGLGWRGHLIPVAWPRGLRVLWWLVVAAAAGTQRWALDRSDGPSVRLVPALALATPFAVFAVGIALGAGWATFH
jgi:hypothetical protein